MLASCSPARMLCSKGFTHSSSFRTVTMSTTGALKAHRVSPRIFSRASGLWSTYTR
ncbi:hypothetical protein [Acidaminococcus fermentans]|uniref:hypothetical protein n=1 Tax=Acidaminococcus fermentans TaxID=905 RepID=UPI003F8B9D23